MHEHRRRVAFVSVALLLSSIAAVVTTVDANHTTAPTTVSLPGSFGDELGCPGDWQPECTATQLLYDAADDVWQRVLNVPAGNWEYKAALNGTWDENYGAGAEPGGPNIALTLAEPTDVKFYYSHATHWITDNVTSTVATAPGSFQSELGCPGDWQPDCLRSWLQDPDGDGTYQFTTTAIPPGAYEWKVAINESWDENYGEGGVAGGPNLSFTVTSADQPVTLRWDSVTKVPSAEVGPAPCAEPAEDAVAAPPVRTAAEDEVIYFVMPDRFDDGNPANNTAGDASGDPLVHGYLPTHKGYYHGGDLAGVLARLDYLQGMGVTALWVTPPFTNRWVQGDGTVGGSSAGYHGYWQVDYTQIDPHFGTNQEMIDLIADAHARGMKVYFDIITNHTADVITYQEGTFTYRNKANFPYRDAEGNVFDDRDYAGTGDFPTLDPATSFPYTPTFADPADATAKTPAWLNDPIYYHNRGNSTFVGEDALYGDFVGLDDLFTEHPFVVDGLIDIHKNFITTFGIDGFRVDTVKHVNDEFWDEFVPAILQHAADAGNPDFAMFGEVFDSSPEFVSRFSTELPFPSTLDFRFHGAATDVAAASTATNRLRDLFADDDWFTDADSNAYGLVKFIGNHDIGRIGRSIDVSNAGASDAERVARARLAQAINFTTRGAPVIYYGDEQGFTGDGGDQDARQDMFASQVASYNDDDLIGTADSTAAANFDVTHPLYIDIAELAALHNDPAHAALRTGAQLHRYSEGSAGIYAFSRIDRDEQVEYVVAINNSEAPDAATFATDTPNGTFTQIFPAGAPPVTSDASGTITVGVPALDVVVYRADAPVPTDTDAEAVSLSAPAPGATVTGRVPVKATVDGGRYAEVTFSVSVDGGPYEVLGTDDNSPYGVYHDVAGLAPGTCVRYKAIAADLGGNTSSADVTANVGVDEPPSTDQRYAVIHYQRPDGDYGDPTSPDFNQFWGLHLWDDIDESIDWTAPKPFIGEDDYGRFAWVALQPGATNVGFIVHRGDTKDGTTADRFFDPSETPEIWLRADDAATYTSAAAAQGYATVHYRRDDGNYDGWGLHLWGDGLAPGVATDWSAPRQPDGIDDFGAFWDVPISDADPTLNFIIHRGDEKDPGPDQGFVPAEHHGAWIVSGDTNVHRSRSSAEGMATIHYRRPCGDYGDSTSEDFNDFWGLHTWGGATDPGWTTPRKPAGQDGFGVVFEVPLLPDATALNYILHRGDVKDPGPDQSLDLVTTGHEVWQLEGADPDDPYLIPLRNGSGVSTCALSGQRAYWVSTDTILWDAEVAPGAAYALHYAPEGGLEVTDQGVDGDSIVLTPGTADPSVFERFPHLTGLPALRIAAEDLPLLPELLTGQLVVAAAGSTGEHLAATGLQIPGVLDDLYANDAELGVTWDSDVPTLRVWAPTAKSVALQLFADGNPATAATALPMTRDDATGVWSVTGDPSWSGQYYLYDVEVYVPSIDAVVHNLVTDPYSLSLSTNSARSQIVDLGDPDLEPAGWDGTTKPSLAAPEDLSIYELHVRDFSANDPSVPAELKGTYEAFTLEQSNGMQHLAALADAGLGAVHLLPVFDIATINEDRSQWQQPDPAMLATYPPDSDQQQAAVMATAAADGFNWGYDPWHYTTPEGSYATDPEGTTRIEEFRDMVQALNGTGLRVIMDVVYNHTNASGQSPRSVLDRIVPGYYHRLNGEGAVETSTCCANTASEHEMMEKLLIDSVVTWAREYKVDGFRFDLMGHHSKATMVKLRAALDALTLEDDGVDGTAIYLYGEGWNFGEVANDARFVQATQLNMDGTGIGTFNDRLRDAVRGGGPFDGGEDLVLNQGVVNGVWYDPNELVVQEGVAESTQLDELLLSADQIRVGLAGNLAGYTFEDRTGAMVTGAGVDYNGSPAGYTADPQEHIVYVEAHDNQTLFDVGQYHHPLDTAMADRVRAQNLGIDFTVLSQGVPFFHAGMDLLRSKSMDRNSYDSGDWFNRLDFTYQTNNWGVGLPPAQDNQSDWSFMQERLANPALRPTPSDIEAAAVHLQEMLELRGSTPLFRLQTADEVQERLAFHNTGPDQIPGLIAMTLADPGDAPLPTGDLDASVDELAALFNPTDEPISLAIESWAGKEDVSLHAVLAGSADPVVRSSSFDDGTFTVPARTTAVFVDAADDTTPPILTAELEAIHAGARTGTFRVVLDCHDEGTVIEPVADVNGVPVADGDMLRLILHDKKTGSAQIGPLRVVWGRSFTLTATCTDAAGNTTTVTDVAEFR